MAKKKSAKSSRGGGMTKTAFVASVPDKMPAKEVVAKAKAAGIDISAGVVHAIRSNMRKKAGGRASRPVVARGPSPARRAPASSPTRGGGHVEDLLRAVAAEIGLGRAIEVLEKERTAVKHALRL